MANNYVIGRGKVYFDKFDANGNKTGERYVGNTPSLSGSSAYQNLDHYSSDEGLSNKDDSVETRVDRSLTFSCDSIDMPNVALMFGADDPVDETVANSTGNVQTFMATLDRFYQLGTNLSPDGVGNVSNVVVTDNSGLHAYGFISVAAQPAAADTVTINGHVVTFVSGTPTAHQVQIGSTTAITAQRLLVEINANPTFYAVNASGAENSVNLQAIANGTGGNAITLAKSGTNPTLSGATLTGGSASGVISGSNYTVDLVGGRLQILAAAPDIDTGDTIQVQFDVALQTRAVVIDAQTQVEGAVRFISDNPKGDNKNWYWPRVKLTPSGDFALKGDTWQTMTLAGEILTPADGSNRVYVRAA